MKLIADSFDELYTEICSIIINTTDEASPRNFKTFEILGNILILNNPRTRILQNNIRKISLPFAIGEWVWTMTGSDSLQFIQYYAPSYGKYSDDGKTLHGAYGPRIKDQIPKIIKVLKKDKESRRAVLSIYNASDVAKDSKDIPCTLTLQFLIRSNKLTLVTNMRSNDVYLGLPYDVFNFTMIQEYVATLLNVEVGAYIHIVNSLHVYEKDREKIKRIASNPSSTEIPMRSMLSERVCEKSLENFFTVESKIRGDDLLKEQELQVNGYFEYFKNILLDFKRNK